MSDQQQVLHLSAVWKEIRGLARQNRRHLLAGLPLITVNRLSGMVIPASGKLLVDNVILGGRADMLPILALVVGGATLVQAATGLLLTPLIIAAQRTIAEVRKGLHRHVLRLPVSFFDSTQTGSLITRIMSDAEGLRNLIGLGLVRLVGSLLTVGLSLVFLFYLNWKLTTIILGVLLVFGIMLFVSFNYLRPLARQRSEIQARVSGRLAQALAGVRIVKAYTAEKREDLVFVRGIHELFRNIVKALLVFARVNAFTTLLFGSISCLMLWLGGRAILNGTMSLGDFVTYIFFTAMIAISVTEISDVGTQIAEAFGGLDRVRELRRVATETHGDRSLEPLDAIRGDVVFDHVCFEYQPGVPVLKDISFEASAGSCTALVGSSGAGKSTLISLVMSFIHPTSGRLLVDGRDLSQVRLRDYRSQLGIVLQDDFLFDGTIAENIGYGRPYATTEEIRRAGHIAHCDVFIEQFADGYDTLVGERGVRLSGGQRQRLAIARAILADPAILILDEATSSLDSESEALIQDGLQALRQGRTTFVIAHRLSTIRSADQILVLEDGKIVERGTHDELFAQNGRYRELYAKQYRLEQNRFVNPGEDFTTKASAAAVAQTPPSLPVVKLE